MQPDDTAPQDENSLPQEAIDLASIDPTQTEIPIPPAKPVPVTMESLRPYILAGAGAVILVVIGAYFLGTIVGRSQMQGVKKIAETTPTPRQPTPTRTFKQSENPMTANWNLYTNNAIGFQMKFPPQYAKPMINGKNEYVTGNETEDVLKFSPGGPNEEDTDSFVLNIKPFTGSVEDYLKAYVPTSYASNSAVIKKEVTVGGNEGVWYRFDTTTDHAENPDTTQTVYFVGNKYSFELVAPYSYPPSQVEAIISSFFFTK